MAVMSTITANAVRLQDGNVMGLLSIHMVNTDKVGFTPHGRKGNCAVV
jgi:hypothetical protein